jgi:hypothetical protein
MRVFATLALAITYGGGVFAQAPGSVAQAPSGKAPAAQSVIIETDARQVREQFESLLMKYPPEVGRILKMDPTMLTNQPYLSQYPAIQAFLTGHPEIARNPTFYLEAVRYTYDYTRPADPRSQAIDVWRNLMESVSIFAVVVFIASMVAWLVKTLLNHRRWLRVTKVQTEVHNKLLERFAGTNELLAYVQSSPGRRFLEAAPVPLDAPVDRPIGAPLSRILWSVQAGIVLVVGGFGFQYVSGRIIDEVAQGLWTIGVLGVAFGAGFIMAGGFSYLMSRRLGLLDAPPLQTSDRGDSSAV